MDELLIGIWAYTDLRDRFVVSQVSKRWRQVALSAPTLWSLIDLEHNHGPRLRNLLQRSGSSPLHLIVNVKQPPNQRTGLLGLQPNSQPFSFYNHRRLLYDPSMDQFDHMNSTSNPPPLLTQKEFDEIVTRCVTLDAFVGESKLFYVTSKTLNTPMPYLKTLRLMEPDSSSSPFALSLTPVGIPIAIPIFGKETPRLRELHFEYIHAQWEDPIYKDLTVLRLSYPKQRITIQQLLQILDSCLKMKELELKGCLEYGASLPASNTSELDSRKVVGLSRLNHFHFEDYYITSMVDLLSSLSLPSLDHLHIVVNGYGGFTDKYGRPLKSLLPTIGKTTDLLIGGKDGRNILQGLNRGIMTQIKNRKDSNSGRWYFLSLDPNRKISFRPFPDEPLRHNLAPPITLSGSTGMYHPPIRHITPTENDFLTRGHVAEWAATEITLGVPSIGGASPGMQYPNPFSASVRSSSEFMDVLEQASLGGLSLHKIERLELTDGTYYMDDTYRDIFARCEGIQKLKVSYNKGIGILNAIIKQKLCPMLTEVYLSGIEVYPSYHQVTYSPPSPTLLADWVESRQNNSDLQPLTRLIVQFSDNEDIILDAETRKRIEDGLGDNGVFIWKTIWSPAAERKRKWTKFIEEDDEAWSADMGIDETGSGGSKGMDKETLSELMENEWPLSTLDSFSEWRTGLW